LQSHIWVYFFRLAFDQLHKNIFGKRCKFYFNGTEISILIINTRFILQNNKMIFSVSSLFLIIFLNSAGNAETRPTDALQPNNLKDNDTFLWLGELENPNLDREESGLGDEKFLNVQLYATDDNSVTEGLGQLEKSSKSDLQETGIQAEASPVEEGDEKVTQVSRTARNAGNACIERYVYRIIYNRVFRIPVCKQGCKSKFRTINFSNGRTLAIVVDCYI